MKDKETTGRIVPVYDGNFSTRMVWDEERLARVCRAADLRTKIYIKAGEANPKKQQENLGEVLAWKQIVAPGQLFRTTVDVKV